MAEVEDVVVSRGDVGERRGVAARVRRHLVQLRSGEPEVGPAGGARQRGAGGRRGREGERGRPLRRRGGGPADHAPPGRGRSGGAGGAGRCVDRVPAEFVRRRADVGHLPPGKAGPGDPRRHLPGRARPRVGKTSPAAPRGGAVVPGRLVGRGRRRIEGDPADAEDVGLARRVVDGEVGGSRRRRAELGGGAAVRPGVPCGRQDRLALGGCLLEDRVLELQAARGAHLRLGLALRPARRHDVRPILRDDLVVLVDLAVLGVRRLVDEDPRLRGERDDVLDVEGRLEARPAEAEPVDAHSAHLATLGPPEVAALEGRDVPLLVRLELVDGDRLARPEVATREQRGEAVHVGDGVVGPPVGADGGRKRGLAGGRQPRRVAAGRSDEGRLHRSVGAAGGLAGAARLGRAGGGPGAPDGDATDTERLCLGELVQADHSGDGGRDRRRQERGSRGRPAERARAQPLARQLDVERRLDACRRARRRDEEAVGGKAPDVQPVGPQHAHGRGDRRGARSESRRQLLRGQEVMELRRARCAHAGGVPGQADRVPRAQRHPDLQLRRHGERAEAAQAERADRRRAGSRDGDAHCLELTTRRARRNVRRGVGRAGSGHKPMANGRDGRRCVQTDGCGDRDRDGGGERDQPRRARTTGAPGAGSPLTRPATHTAGLAARTSRVNVGAARPQRGTSDIVQPAVNVPGTGPGGPGRSGSVELTVR